jgi:hypothetical protein
VYFYVFFSNPNWIDVAPQGRGHWSSAMKKIVTAFVLATLLATPALAQKRHTISPQAAAAQASVPYNQTYPTADPYTVIVNGRIVGRDPDPNVRLMLKRDPFADAA